MHRFWQNIGFLCRSRWWLLGHGRVWGLIFINKKLTYINNDNDNKIIGYADASYAEEKDRKSITGFCFKRFGGVITWRTKKQNLVTKSSTEAEYVAISTASDEVLWLQKLVKDIH